MVTIMIVKQFGNEVEIKTTWKNEVANTHNDYSYR
jgi:hypothetical protein